jgi:lysozyme
MEYSKVGLEQLTEAFEGCRLSAYQDSKGIWTIGYGHTFYVNPTDTCSQEQAESWLLADVAWAEAAVNRYVTVLLTQGEFDALTDFTFNLGTGSLQHSTLLKLVNAGDFAHAANEFEKWDRCGGVEVAGLLRRRLAEKKVFNL